MHRPKLHRLSGINGIVPRHLIHLNCVKGTVHGYVRDLVMFKARHGCADVGNSAMAAMSAMSAMAAIAANKRWA